MRMENHGGKISTGDILIRLPELSGNPTSSYLVAKQEELEKEMIYLAYEISHIWKVSLTCRKILRHGADNRTILPRFREVPSSNLGPQTDYPD
jgi:hypothetical protein